MIELTILPNGALKISATPEDVAEACLGLTDKSFHNEIEVLNAMLEPCWTNGQYYVFDASQLGHMTEAPLIADSVDYGDDGSITEHGPVWWFPDYCVENCIETLLKKGEVTFELGYTAD